MWSRSVRRICTSIARCAAAASLAILAPACSAQAPVPEPSARVCSRIPASPPSYASRIAFVACSENALWYGPFVDQQGRLASLTVSETERLPLQDGTTAAWQRVAEYWNASGLMAQVSHLPGAADCAAPATGHLQSASCRAFLTDTPWSAAFVSYVMVRAGVPGFVGSASHIDFVRQAYLDPGSSPYRLADPDTTPPAAGDLLCFVRMHETLGFAGLREFLDGGSEQGLNMHCDIVVAARQVGENRAYLVGGNVLQGVTLRMLPLNRKGLLWGLPRRGEVPAACHPGNEAGCNFNRQDWAALLKLKPLPVPTTPMAPPGRPAVPQCCTQCPLPMPPGMRRCPPVLPSGTSPVTAPEEG